MIEFLRSCSAYRQIRWARRKRADWCSGFAYTNTEAGSRSLQNRCTILTCIHHKSGLSSIHILLVQFQIEIPTP